MSDGPYDFARERREAMDEALDTGDYVKIDGRWYDAADLPSEAELAEDERQMRLGR